jgi:hypothetical protein
VADRIDGYFDHGEAKSQGSVGLLERKCVAGLTKVWIGKESHPLADTEDLQDDETLEAYRADAVIIPGMSVNRDLIKSTGVANIAKAARINEASLFNAVNLGSSLPKDYLAKIRQAINVDPIGTIHVTERPMSKLETAGVRLQRILFKKGKLREFARFIHSEMKEKLGPENNPPKYELILRDVASAADGKKEMGVGLTPEQIHAFAKECIVEVQPLSKQIYSMKANAPSKDKHTKKLVAFIFEKLDGAMSKDDVVNAIMKGGLNRIPAVIKHAAMETYARKFYGHDAAAKAKEEKAKTQNEYFKTTAHDARARWDKSRANKKNTELARLTAAFGLLEVPDVRSAKILQRRLEPFQDLPAGMKIKKLLCGFGLLNQADDKATS